MGGSVVMVNNGGGSGGSTGFSSQTIERLQADVSRLQSSLVESNQKLLDALNASKEWKDRALRAEKNFARKEAEADAWQEVASRFIEKLIDA
jgi:hypothetical protein